MLFRFSLYKNKCTAYESQEKCLFHEQNQHQTVTLTPILIIEKKMLFCYMFVKYYVLQIKILFTLT